MRILLVTPQMPYPPEQGTSLRNYHILRGLAERHDVHLLSYGEACEQTPLSLARLCATITCVPEPRRSRIVRLWRLLVRREPDMAHRLESPSFDATLRTVLAETQFDVVQIEGIELARSIPLVRTHQPQTAILFDDHNAEAELQRRAFLADVGNPGRWAAAAYSLVQTRRLQRFEAWACRAADAVTVVSEADRRQLARLVPELEATVIPNCIDVSQYGMPADPAAPSYDLVFTGKMDYRPNVDAVLWFAEAIWPEIVRERPETTWAIVGKQPHRRLASLKGLPGIMVTGRVESVEPYLEGATVYVMPFRIGSGTRLKLIEAMASKKAIVSTTVGAEGFPVVDGKELILADDAHTFAAKVLELLAHPAKREQLGQTARQLALQYDWRNVVTRFEAVYDRIVGANLPK